VFIAHNYQGWHEVEMSESQQTTMNYEESDKPVISETTPYQLTVVCLLLLALVPCSPVFIVILFIIYRQVRKKDVEF